VIPARPERRVLSDVRQQSVHVGRLELLYLHSVDILNVIRKEAAAV